jgi:hypothetical protein
MWKMAHYMDALSKLFDEAEPDEGEDTTGAVEGDVNPTIDAPAPKGKGDKKDTPKKGRGSGNGEGGKNQVAGAGAAEPKTSKKALKRAARQAEQKLMDEETASNGGNEKERERSPADLPDAKRAKVGSGEVLREAVSNAA